MNSSDIVARVACRILRDKVSRVSDCIKLYFQGLPVEAMVACTQRILTDPVLSGLAEVHLSRKVFEGCGLPESILSNQAVGDFRNEEPEQGKKLMLLGPPDESEWDTVRMMQAFGEQELMEADSAWVDEFAPDILDEIRKGWWRAALRGLNSLQFTKLDEFATFVARTSSEIELTGQLQEALGRSLPALRLPRRSDLFTIPDRQRGQMSQWKKKINDHKRTTQCFLTKRDKSEALIDNDILSLAVKEYKDSDECDAETVAIFENYVVADYGWTAASAALSEVEWNVVNAALFERVRATKKQNLGIETLGLFNTDSTLPDLPEEDVEYLNQLAAKGEPADEDRAFFRRYYRELQNSPPLFSRWESFILEKSVEDGDFLNGLARCLRILRPRTASRPWKLIVKAKAAKDKDLFLLNEQAATYFATRYRGIDALLHPHITFHGMRVLQYPTLLAAWRIDNSLRKKLKSSSVSRNACQLVFYIELEDDSQRQIKLVWRFNPKAIAGSLRNDLERLVESKHTAVHTGVVREATGRRALPLSLEDVSGLQPAFGRAAGSLIPQSVKLKSFSVNKVFSEALLTLVNNRNLSYNSYVELLQAFDDFEKQYQTALRAFLDKGMMGFEEAQQACDAFAALLDASASKDYSDTVLGSLLPLLLSISIVTVDSFVAEPRPMAIVPPWHPLRLLAMLAKGRQFKQLVTKVTSDQGTLSDADGSLLFEDVSEWLSHVYYPEVACHLVDKEAMLLSVCASHYDYSLHEPPVLTENKGLPTDADPKEAAIQVGNILASYLDLQPHERDNLSVVLFDCSSTLLPQAVVEQIRSLSEDDEQDAMCQVVLAHTDPGKLRGLYRNLTSIPDTADTFNTSEATREFMARLRINIMVGETVRTRETCHPYDVVFSEDTIARHAKLKWYPIPTDIQAAEVAKPSAWSRRRPMQPGATTSAVFLSSPAGPKCVWRYLNALAFASSTEEARRTENGQCLVAARALEIHSHAIGKIVDSMHSLGRWVVNYDELLHRKLLENKGIRIIRYKQNTTQGRNVIISSTAKDSLLRSALRQLCSAILPDMARMQLDTLVSDLISEANGISGNLVLRAVRRAENAKELLGLVLSKYVLQSELGNNRLAGWFLLDDYASWLGEEESQMADLLCLAPHFESNGKPVLDVVVTEAKFTEHSTQSKGARESANQLRQTLAHLEGGITGDRPSLDREIWLARISDLIVDGMEAPAVETFDALNWRKMVRSGYCDVRLRGYSHVFDWGIELATPPEPKTVRNTRNGLQEIFSLTQLRDFLRNFAAKQPISRRIDYRHSVGAERTVVSSRCSMPQTNTELSREIDSVNISLNENSSTLLTVTSPPDIHQEWPVVQDSTNPLASEILSQLQQWQTDTATAIRRALIGYDMPAELAQEPILTPNSLLFKFRGSDRLTAAAIEKKRAELYTTHGLKVVNVRPEAGAVAISIERPHRDLVHISDAWQTWKPRREPNGNTKLLVGVREEDNSLQFLDPLSQSPHTLIAGTSGSGKSVLLQNILLGIAATNSSQTAKIVLIDPKHGVDYGPLATLPNIEQGIITSADAAIATIESLVVEMEARYPSLQSAGVNHIQAYNKKAEDRMPYIWLIHDEFADWMQNEDYRTKVVSLVNRLGMKARAAGIFLIFAAQRPSVDVMPMQLRDNLDNRLILRVAQEGTSMFCLGEKGAENLLPRGQMLSRLGGSESVLCQVPYVDFEILTSYSERLGQSHTPNEPISL